MKTSSGSDHDNICCGHGGFCLFLFRTIWETNEGESQRLLSDDKSQENSHNHKVVHAAIRWDKIDEVRSLLVDNLMVNMIDEKTGNLPIHIAAQNNGNLTMMELLVENGASVNACNLQGNTPLHMAVEFSYYECAKYLVCQGADLNKLNHVGNRAASGIAGNKSLAMAALLTAERKNSEVIAREALALCEENIVYLRKEAFAIDCMKLKKKLADRWTNTMQTQFKVILAKL